MDGEGAARSVADVRAELRATLSRFIPAGSRVALLDFPSYPNVGDSASWLGTVAELRRLGCTIAYVCDQRSYRRAAPEGRPPRPAPPPLAGGGHLRRPPA